MVRIGVDIRNVDYKSGFSRAFHVLLQGLVYYQDKVRITFLTDTDKADHNLIDKIVKKPEKIPWRLWLNSPAVNKYLEGIDLFLVSPI